MIPVIIVIITAAEVQPQTLPCITPINKVKIATESRLKPIQSMCLLLMLGVLTFTKYCKMMNAMMLIGRFTQKIQRHDMSSVNTPPRKGPAAREIDAMDTVMPMA